MTTFAQQLQEYMQRYGVADPSKLFGGDVGLIKTGSSEIPWESELKKLAASKLPSIHSGFSLDDIDMWGGQTALNSGPDWGESGGQAGSNTQSINKFYTDPNWQPGWWGGEIASNSGPDWGESGGQAGSNMQTEWSARQQALSDAWPEYAPIRDQVTKKYEPLKGKYQITPELLNSTLLHSANPEGFNGGWIRDMNSIKYDPGFGLYLNDNDATDYYSPNKYGDGWFNDIFEEVGGFLQDFGPIMAVAGGGAALGSLFAGGAAGAGAGALGAGEVGGTLYGVGSGGSGLGFNAGSFLGGAGATPGVGFVAPSAAGWGGFGAGTLGSTLGAGGDMSWYDDLFSGFSDADTSFFDNFQFPSNDAGGLSYDDAWWDLAQNTDLGIGQQADMLAEQMSGFSQSDFQGLYDAMSQSGFGLDSGGSFIDSLKSLYDEYGKPIKTGYDLLDKALSPGSTTGGLGRLLASGLGAYGAYSESSDKQDLADKYFGMGEPYRQRLSNLYANPEGFLSSKEVQVPVQQGTDMLARSLSTQGNPVASGNALQQLQSYSADQLFGKLGQEKDRLAGFGGLTEYNSKTPLAEMDAIGSKSNIFNAAGAGLNNIFNPPKEESLADLLKRLR